MGNWACVLTFWAYSVLFIVAVDAFSFHFKPNGGMVDFAALSNSNSNSTYQQALEVGLDAPPYYNTNALEYDPNMSTQWMVPPQPQLYPDPNRNMMSDQTLLMEQHHFNNNSLPPFPRENPTSANFYFPPWE